jgi:hypothetical protein
MAVPNPALMILTTNQRSQSMNAITEAANLELKEGEKLAFSITLPDGKTIHTILLPGDEKKNWNDALEWAKSLGGDLPDRAEQALLFKYLPEEFQKDWYWSNTQHASDSACAWGQDFGDGFQYGYGKSDEGRARAVRRSVV